MITWDVDRVIFQIYGPIALRWYSLFFLTGFVIGTYAFTSMAKKEGKDPSYYVDTGLLYLIAGTLIGARLGHCIFYEPSYYLANPLKIFQIWNGGLASHGGYLGCMIATILLVRKYKELSLPWLGDRVAILAVMAGGFIRLGNLFNSEILGKVTDVPWAFIFVKVDTLPRHPTQIYEALAFFFTALCGYLYYRKHNRKPRNWSVVGLMLALGFTFRAIIERFKENQVSFEDDMLLNMGQLLSFPFIAVGLVFFFGWHRKLFRIFRG